MRLLSTALWVSVVALPSALPAFAHASGAIAAESAAAVPERSDGAWRLLAEKTLESALQADGEDRTDAALLLQAHRWARLMAQTEADACRDWVDGLRQTGTAPRFDPSAYRVGERSLAQIVSPQFAGAMFADPVRTAAFFDAVSPTDNVVRVLEILRAIDRAEPDQCLSRFELALAIAVVFDSPPRHDWPHAQVDAQQLRRQWPDPVAAFRFWSEQDRAGRLVFPLETLGFAQLACVVDATASFEELTWAQQFCPTDPRDIDAGKLLQRVPYRGERVTRGEFQWQWPDYRLRTILATGGICTEQAYFASQVLKSRGVPSAVLSGSGREGRHAWIGYQRDVTGRWRLDAGKNQNASVFNTVAIDPHTWREVDEWQLLQRGDPHESSARHRHAAAHAAFAGLWRTAGDADLALRAAQRAVGVEPQRESWWRLRLDLHREFRPADLAGREAILREALAVRWSDPAIEARFVATLAQLFESRGDALLAAAEWDRFASRLQRWRLDQQLDATRTRIAAEVGLGRISSVEPLARKVVVERGRSAGVAMLDRFVYPLVQQLRAAGHTDEADELLELTRVQLGSRVPAVSRELERVAQRAPVISVSDVR